MTTQFSAQYTIGNKFFDKRPTFYQAIDFVNVLYERTLTEGSERNWLPHVPFMFDIDIVTGSVFKLEGHMMEIGPSRMIVERHGMTIMH